MKKLLFSVLAIFGISFAFSCSKSDDEKITQFIADKGWTAAKTDEGLYYVIDSSGVGTTYPTLSSTVKVKYKGYLLDGTVFDQSAAAGIEFGLAQVIEGWQIGIPKFKKGGKGKLIIPASLGYGSRAVGSIPSNSVLVFEIELFDFR
ncbi:MAG: hypothetical protein RL757_1226 [Bacteroidota bacterium]|jgi:FKBP-type peptidyl-prolyl cis-trans isomerase FkpA